MCAPQSDLQLASPEFATGARDALAKGLSIHVAPHHHARIWQVGLHEGKNGRVVPEMHLDNVGGSGFALNRGWVGDVDNLRTYRFELSTGVRVNGQQRGHLV